MEHIMMGHSLAYWAELQSRFEKESALAATDLLQEVVTLRGKVAFYESRIEQMASLLPRRAS